jgi:hypothetical protein
MMANPGKMVRWGAINIKLLPSLSIEPQLGVGGCTPNPKKLSPASAVITLAIPKVA